jgi:hypothetical protein
LLSATSIDLNNDGIPDVTFKFVETGYGAYQLVYPGAKGGALIFGTIGSNEGEPYPLPWRARVGPTAKFEFRGGIIDGVRGCHSQCFSFGIWEGLSDRYLGVRFLVEGAVHYGWVRISVTSGIDGTISGYAYETTPNKPIIAGKTSGPVKALGTLPALRPAQRMQSLGALACGADGIAIWRREEEAAA